MQTYIWRQKQLTQAQLEQVRQVVVTGGVSPLLARLYVYRGLSTKQEIDQFNEPSSATLHDPFLYKDMDKAVDRLNVAISREEKILVYGDYDVDGTTSIALVYRYLSNYHKQLGFYVPDRDTEGYGISMTGIDYARQNGYTLVIALDCGIKDIAEIDYANSLGIDFIICDHHNSDGEIPHAVAVLDAKRSDNTYPYNELSGCGVGYKFMQAFAIRNGYAPNTLEPLLDLLAMSIASDIVPLTGENRALIIMGLKRLNSEPSLGVRTLLNKCELQLGSININDLVFKIGPRINASGRIDSAEAAVRLLIADNDADAQKHCTIIDELNDQRRDLDRQTTEQALKQIDSNPILQSKATTVVYDPNWAKGVVGIVASRLIERYYRPTIVLTDSNGLIGGSARSVADFDLYDAIRACADDLETFGGHNFAAGLSLKPEKLEIFKQHFEQYVAQHITEEQKIPHIEYDMEIKFSDISRKFFDDIQRFSPYGQSNPQPIFVTRGVYNIAATRCVGKTLDHLRLEVSDGSINGKMIGIGFGMKDFYQPLHDGQKVDICYTIEENVFQNKSSIQLHIKDIKLSEQN